MKITEPKFCNFCKEMVYSRLCPFCECPAGDFDYGRDDNKNDIQVDEGAEESFDEGGIQALNFDECYGVDDE